MKNKLICLMLAVLMVFSVLAVLVSCTGGNDDVPPVDGKETDVPPTPGKDGKKDDENKQDTHDHVDADKDGKCDVCGVAYHQHVDENSDGKCDICGGSMIVKPIDSHGEEWWKDITYDTTSLIFQLTDCTNKEELPSGCKRFMAGEDASATGNLDNQVATRNADAAFYTKTNVKYNYYPDTAEYGWSQNINTIYQAVQTKTASTPDMFCNFMTDMLCASLKGSFANLYSAVRSEHNWMDIDAKGEIDFEDDYFESGYMDDLMSSLTLSLDKIYVVASDYFIDLIRAFFIVPVNRALYDSIAPTMIEDLNGDGEKNIKDFFAEVRKGDWNYERLAQYAGAIYRNDSGATEISLADRVGFAVDASSGLSTAGLLYTSSVSIIKKEYNVTKYDYDYSYPPTNQDLLDFAAAEYTLFGQTGVAAVTASAGATYGATALQAIRNRFADNMVLFGGVILLGSLEYEQYQNMKKTDGTGGFGIVPVPVYKAGDNYLTQIHVVGRAGAIAQCTQKFEQCTAFLQYQSTHSSQILDDYYNIELMYTTIDHSLQGNIDILRFIRSNVRTSFDKLFEDAIGFFYESTDPDAVNSRWHAILIGNKTYEGVPYRRTDMAQIYASLYQKKQANLQTLVQEYERLPD